MAKKIFYNIVLNSFKRKGYNLLSSKYVNNTSKLNYECPKGHTHTVSWADWRRNKSNCPYCSIENRKINFEFIKESFEKENYILLEKNYKNNHQKLNYICPKGHRHSMSWSNWNHPKKYRCPSCSGNAKCDINIIKQEFNKVDYILLSTNYINSKNKLEYLCDGRFGKRHKNIISLDNWRAGKRCPDCFNIKLSIERVGAKHWNWRGGISFEPYCELWKDKNYKEFIKERDNFKCMNLLCDSKNPSDLVVHHINYNKKDCNPRNLITLCRSCNSRANINREKYKLQYQFIINDYYKEKNI